jgi:pimeloyl-ACP methyl ester carboxylesterase
METLYAAVSGSAKNPAILFLHGSPLSGRMWQPQMERMTEFFCLAPDLPGHGHSAHIQSQNLETVSGQIAALIRERIPSRQAHIVGLSYGGVVAQGLMKFTPEVVRSVVLSGTSNRMARWLVETQRLNEPFLRLLKPEQLAGMVCTQFGIPREYQKSLSEDFASFSASTLMETLLTYTEIPSLSDNQIPTLVLVGEKETFMAKKAARQLSSTIGRAQGYIVPDVGHVWNLQAPDLFIETLRAWIGGRSLPGALRPITTRRSS